MHRLFKYAVAVNSQRSTVNGNTARTVFRLQSSAFSLAAIALLACAACSPGQPASNELPLAPDWTLSQPDGTALTFSDVAHEQPTILVFWATWCPYCKAFLPHLQSILYEYGAENVRVFAINFRDDGDAVAYTEEYGYTFTVFLDGNDVAKSYGVWGTPGMILVDADQRIVFNLYDHMEEIKAAEDSAIGEMKHHRRASHRAPRWAARVRQELDKLLEQ